jgi:predicted ribosomally synthesized peptide with SipW-like signal peptide
MSNDTQFSISRRKVLAGLGTIGIASAGAGLGTTAFFSDEESVSAELQAGRLDLLVDYRATYGTWLDQAATDAIVDGTAIADPSEGAMQTYVVGQAPDFRNADGSMLTGTQWADVTNTLDACMFETTTDVGAELASIITAEDYDLPESVSDGLSVDGTDNVEDGFFPGYVDGVDAVMFSLNDVKPKDVGEATISLHICDNPAYVGVQIDSTATENGVVEPEMAAGDSMDEDMGELANFIYVNFWLDSDCSNTYDEDETRVYRGSLAGLQAAVNAGDSPFVDGLQISGGCLEPGVHCVAFDWEFICEEEDFEKVSDADGAVTIGDEIRAALGLAEDDEIDVNVAQTDTLDFGLSFNAVQCRHQMRTITTETGDGFAKQEENFNDGDGESSYARARFGSGGAGGTWEMKMGDVPVAGADPQAEFNWASGQTESFSYAYDGSGNATFNLSGTEITSPISAPAGRLAITVKADVDAAIDVENLELSLDGDMVTLDSDTAISASNSDPRVRYLVINTTAADVSAPFEVTGDVTVTLQGGFAGGEEGVAFDVSVE